MTNGRDRGALQSWRPSVAAKMTPLSSPVRAPGPTATRGACRSRCTSPPEGDRHCRSCWTTVRRCLARRSPRRPSCAAPARCGSPSEPPQRGVEAPAPRPTGGKWCGQDRLCRLEPRGGVHVDELARERVDRGVPHDRRHRLGIRLVVGVPLPRGPGGAGPRLRPPRRGRAGRGADDARDSPSTPGPRLHSSGKWLYTVWRCTPARRATSLTVVRAGPFVLCSAIAASTIRGASRPDARRAA